MADSSPSSYQYQDRSGIRPEYAGALAAQGIVPDATLLPGIDPIPSAK